MTYGRNCFSDPDDPANLYGAFTAIDCGNTTLYTCRNHPVKYYKYYHYEFMRIMFILLSMRMENPYYAVSRSVQSIMYSQCRYERWLITIQIYARVYYYYNTRFSAIDHFSLMYLCYYYRYLLYKIGIGLESYQFFFKYQY